MFAFYFILLQSTNQKICPREIPESLSICLTFKDYCVPHYDRKVSHKVTQWTTVGTQGITVGKIKSQMVIKEIIYIWTKIS